MTTQSGCTSALSVLVKRIENVASAKGIRPVRKLAAATGVSKSGIDKIYQNLAYPTFDTLLAIAKACDTTVTELVQGLEQGSEAEQEQTITEASQARIDVAKAKIAKFKAEKAEAEAVKLIKAHAKEVKQILAEESPE